jgi:hypothetical protein
MNPNMPLCWPLVASETRFDQRTAAVTWQTGSRQQPRRKHARLLLRAGARSCARACGCAQAAMVIGSRYRRRGAHTRMHIHAHTAQRTTAALSSPSSLVPLLLPLPVLLGLPVLHLGSRPVRAVQQQCGLLLLPLVECSYSRAQHRQIIYLLITTTCSGAATVFSSSAHAQRHSC